MGKYIQHPSVHRVVATLSAAGQTEDVIELEETARSAEEAAKALGVEVGAIVKTLIFKLKSEVSDTPVAALISGDRRCSTDILSRLAGIEGKCTRPHADEVKSITGYSIGGVSPVGLPSTLIVLMDEMLNRYETVWAAAGHPHCVFPISFSGFQRITNATVSDHLSEPLK